MRVAVVLSNMSSSAIAEDLGYRLKQARLNANLTQADLAAKAGLSRKVLMNAEKGKAQLDNIIAILLSLNMADQLDLFIPKQDVSPLQLAKLKGKERQRASKSVSQTKDVDEPSW